MPVTLHQKTASGGTLPPIGDKPDTTGAPRVAPEYAPAASRLDIERRLAVFPPVGLEALRAACSGLAMALRAGSKLIAIVGPAGSGKTYALHMFARASGKASIRTPAIPAAGAAIDIVDDVAESDLALLVAPRPDGVARIIAIEPHCLDALRAAAPHVETVSVQPLSARDVRAMMELRRKHLRLPLGAFSLKALASLERLSRGNPGKLDQLAGHACRMAIAAKAGRIAASHIERAAAELAAASPAPAHGARITIKSSPTPDATEPPSSFPPPVENPDPPRAESPDATAAAYPLPVPTPPSRAAAAAPEAPAEDGSAWQRLRQPLAGPLSVAPPPTQRRIGYQIAIAVLVPALAAVGYVVGQMAFQGDKQPPGQLNAAMQEPAPPASPLSNPRELAQAVPRPPAAETAWEVGPSSAPTPARLLPPKAQPAAPDVSASTQPPAESGQAQPTGSASEAPAEPTPLDTAAVSSEPPPAGRADDQPMPAPLPLAAGEPPSLTAEGPPDEAEKAVRLLKVAKAMLAIGQVEDARVMLAAAVRLGNKDAADLAARQENPNLQQANP